MPSAEPSPAGYSQDTAGTQLEHAHTRFASSFLGSVPAGKTELSTLQGGRATQLTQEELLLKKMTLLTKLLKWMLQ